jgi:class 3 adenylate cyclase
MDRHEMENTTAEAVAAAHLEDLKLQARYGCKAITYWFDEKRGTAFCLFDAPNPTTIREIHREAHGQVPNEVIEVNRSDVLAYLGRVLDPQLPEGQTLHEPAFRTLMFTDMANSTGITEALGDNAALGLIQKHHQVVRSALAATGGREVKTTGDGFLASFVSVESAVKCAAEIQRALAQHNASGGGFPMQLRIGLGAGTGGSRRLIRVGGESDRARLPAAKPGQILVSASCAISASGRNLPRRSARSRSRAFRSRSMSMRSTGKTELPSPNSPRIGL